MTDSPSTLTEYHLGLTGYPLDHSLSPKLHNAALKAAGLQGYYDLFAVPPEDAVSLATLLEQVRLGALHGLNVTIPHKKRVIPYLDELTPTAKTIGAVNTIWLRNGRLHGDNTDAPGFMRDVERFLGHHSGKRPFALILGAGGSARAVVYALASAGWGVTVAARQLIQAKGLTAAMVEHVSGPLTAVPLTVEALRGIIPGLLVNCTPLGMAPAMNASPWPDGLPLPETAVYDLVYNPRETRLVRDARAAGLPATTGLGMLQEQAALAFTRWTGKIVDFGKLEINTSNQ